ncbi:MAG: TrmB family transcriptional regulator [Candidatus Odinarchaeota archaeon]|nr:TrmB family transcriptional regulator [Candidatus Odinarchaeota archaeon]
MIFSKIKNDLMKFGLTQYEIKAYIALISHGRLSAKEICQVANLPYSKIHEILNRLERKGWIEIEIGRPTYYYPKPPKEVIEATKVKVIEDIQSIANRLIDELQPIFEERGIKEKPDIWIIYGKENIIRKILDIISYVKNEIEIAIPTILTEDLNLNIGPLLTSILVKGIKVKILATPTFKQIASKHRSFKNLEIRYRDQMFGGGIIKDNEEIVLLLSERPSQTLLAIWSKHTLLTTIGKAYFESLWKDAAYDT